MRYSEKIQEVLNLRKGEGKIVSMLMLYSFFLTMALALFFTAASAIFLTQFPITNLPYVYIAACILLLLLYNLYGQLEKYISGKVLFMGEVLVLLLSVLLFRFGFAYAQAGWLAFGLIIWHRVMAIYCSGGFGKLTLILFDVRQSKRLSGLISSMEVPASVLGYLLASVMVPVIGTENLLLISASGLLGAFVSLALLIVRSKKSFSQPATTVEEILPKEKQIPQHVPAFFKNKFIYSLSITCFLAVVAFILIEFAFLSQVDEKFKDEAKIAYFIGIILATGQLLAFFIKTFFYSYLLRQYGIQLALFALPFALGVVTITGIISGLFTDSNFLLLWMWVVIMLVNDTLKSALYNSTFTTLLQPLQKKVKLMGWDILGTVEAVATGISGLILVVLGAIGALSLAHFSLFLLLMLAAWAVSIKYLNKHYIITLEVALKKRLLEGNTLQLNDAATLELLHNKLESSYPGEVLYALDVLCKGKGSKVPELLSKLIAHSAPEVRREVLKRIEALKLFSLQPQVKERIAAEEVKENKKLAIRIFCFLGEAAVVDEISPLLDSSEYSVQAGALVGLFCHGGINGIILAGQRLNEYVSSADPVKRAFAAGVIGEVGIHHFYHPLLILLEDENVLVRKAALKAAGLIRHPRLFAPMLKAVSSPEVFEGAMQALINTGESVISLFEAEFSNPDYNPVRLRRLVYICGRVGGSKSIELLQHKLNFKNIEVRNQILHSLTLCQYKPNSNEKDAVLQTIYAELKDAAWFLTCIEVISANATAEDLSFYSHLIRALELELHHLKKRLLLLLSFIYKSNDFFQVWSSLQLGTKEKRANAIEILDVLVAKELSSVILPLLEDFSIHQQAKILNARFPQKKLPLNLYLQKLINRQEVPVVNIWTQTISLYIVRQLQLTELVNEVVLSVSHPNKLVAETALWALQAFHPDNYWNYLSMLSTDDSSLLQLIQSNKNPNAMKPKLLAVEKVMALKTTRIFGETSEDILVDIASILKEVPLNAEEVVFEKGEIGTCMYIIYDGIVQVHDGETKLAELKKRDFFGELSLLDTEPRSASVTAKEDTLLLRLDQHSFYEIMADRVEVTREIIKILCRRLRYQNQLVAELKEQTAVAVLDKTLAPD
jgi:HEAT repeat protein